jgi:hypothetical protein
MRQFNRSRLLLAGAMLLAVVAAQLATAAPAAASPGLVFRSGVSAEDSAPTKEAAAVCPTGTRVIGGGGFIEGGDRRVQFTRLQASGSFDSFYAGAIEVGSYLEDWSVHAYAICADQPAGLEYRSFNTGSNSDSVKTATATCTGSKKVISAGARIINGDGQVMLDDMAPNGALTSVTATAYEDDTTYSGNWSLYAYAVCANPLPGLELRTASDVPSDSDDNLAFIGCPGAKKVHGLGATMTGALGQAFHAGIYPAADLTSGVAISLEDQNGYANNWYNSIFVICAN